MAFAGNPEWPTIRTMLPPLLADAFLTLDAGSAGSLWAAAEGACRVLASDISENMLARAREGTSDPAIVYVRADLETLTLPEGAFDLAYSSLAFPYVEDFGRLIGRSPGASHLMGVWSSPWNIRSTWLPPVPDGSPATTERRPGQ